MSPPFSQGDWGDTSTLCKLWEYHRRHIYFLFTSLSLWIYIYIYIHVISHSSYYRLKILYTVYYTPYNISYMLQTIYSVLYTLYCNCMLDTSTSTPFRELRCHVHSLKGLRWHFHSLQERGMAPQLSERYVNASSTLARKRGMAPPCGDATSTLLRIMGLALLS